MAETLRLTAEKAGCIVSVSRSHVASEAREGPWSSSGVLLAQESGIVLCHGSVFSPFFLASERQQDWLHRKVLLGESFSPDLQIQVLRPSEGSSQTSSWDWLSGDLGSNLPGLRFNPLSNQREATGGQRCWEAKLVMMVPCPQFQDAFSKVFTAAEQWHFEADEAGEDSTKNCFLHWFAILRLVDSNFHGTGWLSCMPAKLLRKGDPVFTCGSPFGSFCPDIFMNSLSKGIVSNMAGEGNALILTDARCLPGTEGGGVFTVSGNCLHLIGIIVAPLCWKSTEWVGLTLVCAIGPILENVRSLFSGPHQVLNNWLNPMQMVAKLHGHKAVRDQPIQRMLSAVVLVECGSTWGSGVMVTPRLVLTCRHVVSGASTVYVQLQPSPEKTSIVNGKVVFATKDSSPYDVALVELEERFPNFAEPALALRFYTGEDVSIISFGAFGRSCGPSVTSGIVSAVISVEDKPVMLQATCAVHGGSSGGALFATHSGKLLGIVASNTRDNSIGVTYPHLNFSIPIIVLQQAIFEYIRTGSLGGFQELDRVDNKVHIVWRLQREPTEVPLSKL